MNDATAHYAYPISATELIERARKLYTGAVYDVLESLGFPNQVLAADIKPLDPTMVVAGPAFTLKGIPDITGNEQLRERRIELFSAMSATGSPLIDVRDCSFDTQVAHYGEMNATVGGACGVVGAVIDGGCRDSRFLLDRQFPTFCRFQTPIEAYRRWSYYDWQIPISLRGGLTNTVTVNPGDFMLGDLDGVVVIPREITADVIARCEELIGAEDQARADFASGTDPVAVYRKHGRL